jgi:site-specific recombinase XerD
MKKGAFDKRIQEIIEKTGIEKLKPGIMRSTRITHDVAAGQDVQYIILTSPEEA